VDDGGAHVVRQEVKNPDNLSHWRIQHLVVHYGADYSRGGRTPVKVTRETLIKFIEEKDNAAQPKRARAPPTTIQDHIETDLSAIVDKLAQGVRKIYKDRDDLRDDDDWTPTPAQIKGRDAIISKLTTGPGRPLIVGELVMLEVLLTQREAQKQFGEGVWLPWHAEDGWDTQFGEGGYL